METQEFVAIDLLRFHGTVVPCSACPVSRIGLIIAFLGSTSSPGCSVTVTWTGALWLVFQANLVDSSV